MHDFEKQFLFYVDNIAPSLNVNQQSVYLYLLSKALKLTSTEVTVSIKGERKLMGFGMGDSTKPMSESTVTKCFQFLQAHGLIKKIDTVRIGTRLHVTFPLSAANFRPKLEAVRLRSMDEIDFFLEPIARNAILAREGRRCFYCSASLSNENYAMEHVISRPKGDNSYRNIVAACLSCNNSKKALEAEDFVRSLYRDHILNKDQVSLTVKKIAELREGRLVPRLDVTKIP